MKIKIINKDRILGWYDDYSIHIEDIRQDQYTTDIDVRYREQSSLPWPTHGVYLYVKVSIDEDGTLVIYLPTHQRRLSRVAPPPAAMRTPIDLLIWCRHWIHQQISGITD